MFAKPSRKPVYFIFVEGRFGGPLSLSARPIWCPLARALSPQAAGGESVHGGWRPPRRSWLPGNGILGRASLFARENYLFLVAILGTRVGWMVRPGGRPEPSPCPVLFCYAVSGTKEPSPRPRITGTVLLRGHRAVSGDTGTVLWGHGGDTGTVLLSH